MEQALVERAHIAYAGIDTGKLHGMDPLTALRNVGRMQGGVRQSLQILRQFTPDVCLATGGYVCVPVVVACRVRHVPICIYLPDMTPGLAIRWLSRIADRVAVSFPAAADWFGGEAPRGKAVVTGYPVRQELVAAAASRAQSRRALADALGRSLGPASEPPLVLVWGGSQGARSINQATWSALPALLPAAHILHVVGDRDWPLYAEQEQQQPLAGRVEPALVERYHPVAYLHDEMVLALAAADLTVARAGASILGEFPVARLPSILVPLPYGGVGQRRNAEQLAHSGGAVIVEDARLGEDLAPTVLELLADAPRRAAMEAALAQLARPDAALRIAGELYELSRYN